MTHYNLGPTKNYYCYRFYSRKKYGGASAKARDAMRSVLVAPKRRLDGGANQLKQQKKKNTQSTGIHVFERKKNNIIVEHNRFVLFWGHQCGNGWEKWNQHLDSWFPQKIPTTQHGAEHRLSRPTPTGYNS